MPLLNLLRQNQIERVLLVVIRYFGGILLGASNLLRAYQNAGRVFTLFEKMVAQGRTILMVTHDNDLARRVQRAVHVSDGRIVSDHG